MLIMMFYTYMVSIAVLGQILSDNTSEQSFYLWKILRSQVVNNKVKVMDFYESINSVFITYYMGNLRQILHK